MRHGTREETGKGQGGFSLIEVLVVLFIIGLLTVIMTISVSNALKRQHLETIAHECQSVVTQAFTRTTTTGQAVFVFISAPAADNSRTMLLYDDTNDNGVLDTGSDAVFSTTTITGDLVLAAPPSSSAYRSWPSTSTSGTFFIECNTMGRSVDPPNSTTNSSTTTGAFMALPAVISLTHKEMGSGGRLRPNIAFYITVNLLWQPTITKYINGNKVA